MNYYNTNLKDEFMHAFSDENFEKCNECVMKQLGVISVDKKDDFVHLLNESGVYATMQMSTKELIELFIDNIDTNFKLMIGASLLVNESNKSVGFDGKEYLNDDDVKATYIVLRSYFSPPNDSDVHESNIMDCECNNENCIICMNNEESSDGFIDDEDHSDFIPGVLGAIRFGRNLKNRFQKRAREAGVNSARYDQRESQDIARQQMMHAAMIQNQINLEKARLEAEKSKRKTSNMIIISSVALVLLIATAVVIKKLKDK